MKRIILTLIGALMIGMTSWAQNYNLYGSAVLQGGYNFLEQQPMADLKLVGDIEFIRFKIELGASIYPSVSKPAKINLEQIFNYCSQSIGVVTGRKHLFYFLVGGMPWAESVKDEANLHWHVTLESGCDFYLSDLLLFNLEILYMVPRSGTGKNLCLRGGLGIKF